MVIARVVQHSLVVSTLVPGAAAGVGAVHAQMVGGDIHSASGLSCTASTSAGPRSAADFDSTGPGRGLNSRAASSSKAEVGVASLILDAGPLGDDSENGLGLHIGTGYDVRLGNKLSLTPVAGFFGGNVDDGQANAIHLGLAVTGS